MLVIGNFTACSSRERGAAAKTAGAAGMLVQSTPFGLSQLGGNPNFSMASIEGRTGPALFSAHKSPTTASQWSEAKKVFKLGDFLFLLGSMVTFISNLILVLLVATFSPPIRKRWGTIPSVISL